MVAATDDTLIYSLVKASSQMQPSILSCRLLLIALAVTKATVTDSMMG